MEISLGELATRFGCELIGDPKVTVDRVASLPNAGPSSLCFLANPAFKQELADTRAAAVILREEYASLSPAASLVSDNPYECYARMAAVISPPPSFEPGVHPAATVSSSATIADSAYVAANAFIDVHATVDADTYIGPGSVVGPNCSIGKGGRLIANVTLARDVTIGARCILHPGVVIGADGFRHLRTSDGWLKVPQLGGVQIGDDVEVGANSTIDCGALDDTIIEDGVRIDNLVQIGHNCKVGAHTVFVAHCAIAGSTVIGKRCLFGGQSGAVDNVTICDDVILSGRGMVSKDIKEPGIYASFWPSEPIHEWNRQVARFRRLDKLTDRVAKLEIDKS